MSRHTTLDGKTPDPKIIDDISFDEHWQILAPPANLVGKWHRGELGPLDKDSFDNNFTPAYLKYLEQAEVKSAVHELGQKALHKDITVLCYETSPNDTEPLLCHRALLIAKCADETVGLEYEIR